jgi:hypothetical protein
VCILFLLDGQLDGAGESLGPIDGMGISGTERLSLSTRGGARVLLIEAPMA